jgi:putative ABC transport system permease protein
MSEIAKFLSDLGSDLTRLVGACTVVVALAALIYYHKPLLFILKSLARNKLRTGLTAVATGLFVLLVVVVWSVLSFLALVTQEKKKDFKAIVTERWQIPSQMPFAYAHSLEDGAYSKPGDVRPTDSMTWQFFGGTIESGAKPTRDNMLFFFCMDPKKVLTIVDKKGNPCSAKERGKGGKVISMMDGMDKYSDDDLDKLETALKEMVKDPRKVVIGADRLQAMNKRVGEHISVYSFNYKDIVLDDVEIIGAFPPGQYGQSAVMNRDRLNNALDSYKQKNGKPHPLADKTLNLVWLKVPDTDAYNKVAEQIEKSPEFTIPAVKCETASSGVGSFLDAYADLLWIVRYPGVISMIFCMALVISAAIGISVRERRTEMAVLKVLGYSPNHIMALVLGEALLLGCATGLLSAAFAYVVVTGLMGGISLPFFAWFPPFKVPIDALWWGLGLGAGTALVGSFFPAWSARSVKVSEVFAKIS